MIQNSSSRVVSAYLRNVEQGRWDWCLPSELVLFLSSSYLGLLDGPTTQHVVTGRDSVKNSWWSVRARQLPKCPCASALWGAVACVSQGKWCCPHEARITGILFCLSQAFSVSFEKESQHVIILATDKWVWWHIQVVPSLAKHLNFFLGAAWVAVLQRLGEWEESTFLDCALDCFSSRITYMVWAKD